MPPLQLSQDQLVRYSRHIMLGDVGIEGQRRLLASKALVIGAGGLGCPVSLYLAAAGVGTIGIVDFDAVELSNLQRQILYTTDDVGKPKLDRAGARLTGLNPDVRIVRHAERLSSQNAREVFRGYDVIVDGTDNFPTRYLVNDACVLQKKPNVYGSIFGFEGQVSVFKPGEGPCYRCLYPEPPPPGMVPSCAEGGVLGILPGVVGTLQATEALKLLLRKGRPLAGRLLVYNALDMEFRTLKLRRDPACPACGDHPTVTKLIDYEQFCGLGRGGPPAPDASLQISPIEVNLKRHRGEDIAIVDVREPNEYEICRIEGSILAPLSRLEQEIPGLEPLKGKEIVVHCHHGMRSLRAIGLLKTRGFGNLRNLTGGIDEWAKQVEPGMTRY